MSIGLPNHGYKHVFWLDIETYSDVDLKKAGLYAYVESPAFEIIMFQYAIDDGPARVVDCTDLSAGPLLGRLLQFMQRPDVYIPAHNMVFERTCIEKAWGYLIPIERSHCTMVQAFLHGFPGKLAVLCDVLPVPDTMKKLDTGTKLINRFCKPAPGNHKADRYDKYSHPDEWNQFLEYGKWDIISFRAMTQFLPNINCTPRAIKQWHLDQRMNRYGFKVDTELMHAGVKAAAKFKTSIIDEFQALIGQQIKPSQRAKVLEHWQAEGVEIADTKKETIQRYLNDNDDINPRHEQMMRLMLLNNKTSTSKYKAMVPKVCKDGRYRGGLQYAGAARTRRFAGRGFQLQNLPSRGIPERSVILDYIERVKRGDDTSDLGDTMLLASAAIRGLVVASDGKQMAVADLSNIEGRIVAWLAQEEWKLEAFTAYDRGEGADLYKITAASIIGGEPEDIDKSNRNAFGKVPELACGYAGGVGAFQTFAEGFGIAMTDYKHIIDATVPPSYHVKAALNWDSFGYKNGKPDFRDTMTADEWKQEWLISETIKLAWRDRHPATRGLWRELELCVKQALEWPGEVVELNSGLLNVQSTTLAGVPWLLIQLPSGNYLTYCRPEWKKEKFVYYDDLGNKSDVKILAPSPEGLEAQEWFWDKHGDIVPEAEKKTGGLSYENLNDRNQWVRTHSYGGKLLENICQSVARDIMVENMELIEAQGWDLMFTVHDEVIGERTYDEKFDHDKFTQTLARQPAWARGLPLSAEGDFTNRYGKF